MFCNIKSFVFVLFFVAVYTLRTSIKVNSEPLSVDTNVHKDIDVGLIGAKTTAAVNSPQDSKDIQSNTPTTSNTAQQELIVDTNNNKDVAVIEKRMENKYGDKFYSTFHVDDQKQSQKKDKISGKFELTVSDAEETKNGSAVKSLQEAFTFYKNEDYEMAVLYYKKALFYNPQSVEAQFGLGVAYQMLHQYDQAIAAYLKLFSKNYSRKKLVNNLLMCLQHKPYQNALDVLLSIDEKISGYYDVLAQIGVVYMKLGNDPKAIIALTRAYELAPTNAVVAYNLGVLYDREKNIDYAKHFFDIAIKNDIADLLDAKDLKQLNERMFELDEQILHEIERNKKR